MPGGIIGEGIVLAEDGAPAPEDVEGPGADGGGGVFRTSSVNERGVPGLLTRGVPGLLTWGVPRPELDPDSSSAALQ